MFSTLVYLFNRLSNLRYVVDAKFIYNNIAAIRHTLIIFMILSTFCYHRNLINLINDRLSLEHIVDYRLFRKVLDSLESKQSFLFMVIKKL